MQNEITQPDTFVVFEVPAGVLAELTAHGLDMFRADGERYLFVEEGTL